MSKLLKYVVVIALILIAVFAILKFTNKGKSEEVVDKEEVPKKVFEEPQYMIYTVNDKEKYKLTKEDREYSEILDKLNSSIDENYNTKREKLLLSILDIHKEIYSKKSVLRLIYSEAYEIDIVFENDTESTGTISCTYSFASPSSTAGSPNETCTGSNGDYYTHPAFTFGDNQVKGFWIGKYELSSETPTASYGGGSSTTLTARILPNVNSWRKNTISNFSTVIQNMQASNNIYGLSTDKSTTDSHMLTNMEWGAVAYLKNSNYGRCANDTCTEVTINNCSTYTTGIGADTVSASESSTTCTTEANKYNGEKGVLASTTGNVYGVYDMSGGAWEYVMGNMSSTADTYTFYGNESGFASSWYNDYSNQKYVNTYANGTTSDDQSAYNRGRLGDATGEVVASNGSGWYNGIAYFPYSSSPWFMRGGNYSNGSTAGVLGFNYLIGCAVSSNSARAALVWFVS